MQTNIEHYFLEKDFFLNVVVINVIVDVVVAVVGDFKCSDCK